MRLADAELGATPKFYDCFEFNKTSQDSIGFTWATILYIVHK